jgi:putative transposase
MDNVMIVRLWRSIMYECIYLQAFETGSQARAGVGGWIEYYNRSWPHSVFDGWTPEEVYTGREAPSLGHAPEMAKLTLAA